MGATSMARAMLPGIVDSDPSQLWFGQHGCVLRSGTTYSVLMGGVLVGSYEEDEVARRDVLIVIVLENVGATVSWEDVARAFRVGRATVGRAMQRYKAGGYVAVSQVGERSPRKVTPQLRRKVYGLFDEGHGVRAAHRVVRKRISYGTVRTLHGQWLADRSPEQPAQLELGEAGVSNDNADEDPGPRADDDNSGAEAVEASAAETPPFGVPPEPSPRATQRKERSPEELLSDGKGELVQHAGSWVLLALMNRVGVHAEAARWSSKVSRVTLRVVLDAVAVALAIGERCVEGVRRIATPSASVLLRHSKAIGPGWVRRVIGKFAGESATMFRARMTARLLARSSEGRSRIWLYVDNHMRQYTGQHTVRKGWRMQDKRAVPGTPDYYVHDEDGQPLWRVTSPEHESLGAWLPRVLDFARLVLGEEPDIVLSFDRAGAFPETMAELRDMPGAFVTYERRPYTMLTAAAFMDKLEIVLPSRPKKPTVVHYTEARDKNLRKGRGRVRRIALLTEDGKQMNLVTSSSAPAEELIRGHLARWSNQENQMKHEVERWGINQLDSRRVEPYPADAVIPNPGRGRVEHKIALARAAEGKARCRLAELDESDRRRERIVEDIERAVARREQLEALRPSLPKRAEVRHTSVAGKLVRHVTEPKDVLDTIRIVLANIEADLAAALAPHLDRPREAKKVVANLFAAPGAVRLGRNSLRVTLMPAASADERIALDVLLRRLNRERLVLPGDPTARPLHFALARSSSS